MAVWYFNKARVYIKTHMPFSAKFHACFEEPAELERINDTLDYQVTMEDECHYKSLKMLILFFSLCCIRAVEAPRLSVRVSRLDRLRGEWQACSMCSKCECVCRGRAPTQTAKSVPLVQLWVMGRGADSWALSFFTTLDQREHLLSHSLENAQNSTSDTQLKTFETVLTRTCPHSHAHGENEVCKVLCVNYAPFKCVFQELWSWFSQSQKVTVARPATNVLHTRSHRQTHTPSAEHCICSGMVTSAVGWCALSKDWPLVAVGARCWGVSTLRWFPCFYGSPSGSPSSVWTAAWETILSTFKFNLSINYNKIICHLELKRTNSETIDCCTQRQWANHIEALGFYIYPPATAGSHHCHWWQFQWAVWSIRRQEHRC